MRWRDKPLPTNRAVVELIDTASTRTGLGAEANLDTGYHPSGAKTVNAGPAAAPFR